MIKKEAPKLHMHYYSYIDTPKYVCKFYISISLLTSALTFDKWSVAQTISDLHWLVHLLQ